MRPTKRSEVFGREDTRNAGEIVGDDHVGPRGGIEERLNGGEAVMAELEDEEAALLEVRCGLWDQATVEFVAFFAAEQSEVRFVIADFDGKGGCFAKTDVGRIAEYEVEKKWRVTTGEWRAGQSVKQVGFDEMNAVCDGMTGGVALGDSKAGKRDVGGEDFAAGELFRKRDGDAAGACADIEDSQAVAGEAPGTACAEFADCEAIKSDFDEVLGFRARDENVGSDFEV